MADMEVASSTRYKIPEVSFSDVLLGPGERLVDKSATLPEVQAFVAMATKTVPLNLPAGKRVKITALLRAEVVDF